MSNYFLSSQVHKEDYKRFRDALSRLRYLHEKTEWKQVVIRRAIDDSELVRTKDAQS